MKKKKEILSKQVANGIIPDVTCRFKIHDRVVWDSHFGYEIGYFLGEGNSMDTYLIDIRTGLITEPCSHSRSEIYPYTDELIDELTKKYKYEKRFSNEF